MESLPILNVALKGRAGHLPWQGLHWEVARLTGQPQWMWAKTSRSIRPLWNVCDPGHLLASLFKTLIQEVAL